MGIYELYFSNAGVPATSLTPTFSGFLDITTSGTVAGVPSIIEIGVGWYKFNYTPSGNAIGIIDGGSGLADADRYVPFKVTMQDTYLDAKSSDININVSGKPNISTIVASGNAANWSGVTPATDLTLVNSKLDTLSGYSNDLSTQVSGLPTITEIVNSGTTAGWATAYVDVNVTGISPFALSQIVESGNAANWSGEANITSLATQTDVTNARDSVIASGMANWLTASGFSTSSQATTIQSTIDTISGNVSALPSITQIVSSGNAANWSGVANITSLATQSDVTSARDTIIATGNFAWVTATGFATAVELTTVQTYLGTISGYTDSLETGQSNIITNISGIPTINDIVSSGTAAGWGDTITAGDIISLVSGVWASVIDGTLTASGALQRVAAYCSNNVEVIGSGVYDYKNNAGTTRLFTLTGTDTTRTRS